MLTLQIIFALLVAGYFAWYIKHLALLTWRNGQEGKVTTADEAAELAAKPFSRALGFVLDGLIRLFTKKN